MKMKTGSRGVDRRSLLTAAISLAGVAACGETRRTPYPHIPGQPVKLVEFDSTGARKGTIMAEKIIKTDEEWKQQLTPEQYAVARKKGTERAFTGKYYKEHDKGVYRCVCC